MRALGLDDAYGAYIEGLPGITLATVNLMSFCGLHRRLRGAIIGHLAVFEMTSSMPNRRYGDGLRRLGFGPEATYFYDEHVEADAVHESIGPGISPTGWRALNPSWPPTSSFGPVACCCWRRGGGAPAEPLAGRVQLSARQLPVHEPIRKRSRIHATRPRRSRSRAIARWVIAPLPVSSARA